MKIKLFKLFLLLITSMLMFFGCNPKENVEATIAPATQTPTPIIVVHTNTPEIVYPQKIVLFAAEEGKLNLLNEVQLIIQNFAEKNSLVFELRSYLFDPTIPENLFALVLLSDSDSIDELIAFSPETKIISIGSGFEDSLIDNYSSVNIPENGEASEGFIAGYIAAMQTNDWRVGMIGFEDQADFQIGFQNGAEYFCGTCSPLYPPYEEYPLAVSVVNGAGFEQLIAVADILLDQGVQTIYLAPGIDDPGLISYLSETKIKMIGNMKPISVDENLWITSVNWDWLIEIENVLPRIIYQGESGSFSPELSLMDINNSELSDARKNLVSEIIEFLSTGIIDPVGN